jgi:signal transduction histidine kinase
MVVASVSVCLPLTLVFLLQYVSDTSRLHEATLNANAVAIVQAIEAGKNPSNLSLFRDFPTAYGFRVFDHRLLASRRVLASANTRWLPAVQYPAATAADPDGADDRTAIGADLLEGFTLVRPDQLHPESVVSLLIRRVSLSGHMYWVQTYMIGDPAWAGAPVILGYLVDHVFVPALFFIPALTLAMFLTTQAALRPLRRLSDSANLIGTAVARGQTRAPVPEHGMAREFADVASTINTILAKLDRSLQLQKQFTSDVAHELRTPLAVLLLEMSHLPSSPARERIKADLKELGHLVNELLRFAQAEDAMATEASEVDVATLARKVSEEAVAEALAKRQLIEFYCADSATVVRGSSALIEIAIRNLVYNALKYSPSQTTITVRIDPGPIVTVEDCGPGIPPEHRDNVFERFWRMSERMGNGAGVGLALVRRIAQLHDGSIRLEDRPGGGARMILSFAGASSRSLQRKGSERQSKITQMG